MKKLVFLHDLRVELGITDQALRTRLKRRGIIPILSPSGSYMRSAITEAQAQQAREPRRGRA